MSHATTTQMTYPEDTDLGRLVGPRDVRLRPIHRWYAFPHSFSPDLVRWGLLKMAAEASDTVFDPFCGSGTTILEANLIGHPVLGSDILPFSTLISKTKLDASTGPGHTSFSSKVFQVSKSEHLGNEYLDRAFPPLMRNEIAAILGGISEVDNSADRAVGLVALFRVAEEVSYGVKGGAFLRWNRTKRFRRGYAIERFVELFREFQNERPASHRSDGPSCHMVTADARKIPLRDGSADIVITSPPYLNRHDYTRIFLLEMLILSSGDMGLVRSLRAMSLRSHVEARKPSQLETIEIQIPAIANRTMARLRAADNHSNKSMVSTAYGYMQDLYLTLNELYRICEKNARCMIVLSNVRLDGVEIPIDKITEKMAVSIGFEFTSSVIARHRGNSPQQMDRYGRLPMRETVTFLKKV